MYGLDVIAADIADHHDNQTRFVVVAREGVPAPTGNDKTALVIYQRADEPGSLVSILQEFTARRINLSNLTSRPTKAGGLGDYCFIVYAESHVADELLADTMRALHAKQGAVKFLGSYPAAGAHAESAASMPTLGGVRPTTGCRRFGAASATDRSWPSGRRRRRTLGAMSNTPPVSVVTGANSGIGRATAIHLAQQGHRVAGTVRSIAKAEKLQAMASDAGVDIELFELDVADDDSVREGFAEILASTGRVDHLVNNAGVGGNAVAEECPPELYLSVMNVNLCGAVRCLQAVFRRCASVAAARS